MDDNVEYKDISIRELLKGKLNNNLVRITGVPRGIAHSVDFKEYLFRIRGDDINEIIECRGKTEIRGMSLVSLLKTALEENRFVKLSGIFKERNYFEVHSVQYKGEINSGYF